MRERRDDPDRIGPAPHDVDSSDSPLTATVEPGLLSPETDEEAASQARLHYKEHGMEALVPDERIRRRLLPNERVLAIRRGAGLDRRKPSIEAGSIVSNCGDLYLTSERLVHVGNHVITLDLDQIDDAALAGERLLLLLRDGVGVALSVDRPRLFRVQIAAARAARVVAEAE